MNFDTATISKQGGRDYNQDYVGFRLTPAGGAFIVCDGLGAYKGSEDASRIAVESLLEAFAETGDINPTAVEKKIHSAHKDIIRHKSAGEEFSYGCTTVAAVFTDGAEVTLAHIGDTRCYYFHEGKVAHYTLDHSVSQMAVNSGAIKREQIRFHEDRNKLIRVLGGDREPKPEVQKMHCTLSAGDAFLVCSDGFWEYVTEEDMEDDLKKSKSACDWIRLMEKRLIKRASRYNDNYSAVAVRAYQNNDEEGGQ